MKLWQIFKADLETSAVNSFTPGPTMTGDELRARSRSVQLDHSYEFSDEDSNGEMRSSSSSEDCCGHHCDIDEALKGADKAAKTLMYCTQTVLASYFAKATEEWCTADDRHLVDGGRQSIHIITKTSPQKIEIRKPFKLVHLSEVYQSGTPKVEKIIELTVTYNITSDCTSETWRYRYPECDQDWVFI